MFKARLTIDIEYDAPLTKANEQTVRRLLLEIPNRAAGEGLFSGDTELEIETWAASVEFEE